MDALSDMVGQGAGFATCCSIVGFLFLATCAYFKSIPRRVAALAAPLPMFLHAWLFFAVVLGLACAMPVGLLALAASASAGHAVVFATSGRVAVECDESMRNGYARVCFCLRSSDTAVTLATSLVRHVLCASVELVFLVEAVASYTPSLVVDWDAFVQECPTPVNVFFERIIVNGVRSFVHVLVVFPRNAGLDDLACPASTLSWRACFVCAILALLAPLARLDLSARLATFDALLQSATLRTGEVQLLLGELRSPTTRGLRTAFFFLGKTVTVGVAAILTVLGPHAFLSVYASIHRGDFFRAGCPVFLGAQSLALVATVLVIAALAIVVLATRLDTSLPYFLPLFLRRHLGMLPPTSVATKEHSDQSWHHVAGILVGVWTRQLDDAYRVSEISNELLTDVRMKQPSDPLSRRTGASLLTSEKHLDAVRAAVVKPFQIALCVLPFGAFLARLSAAANAAPLTACARSLCWPELLARGLQYSLHVATALFVLVKLAMLSNIGHRGAAMAGLPPPSSMSPSAMFLGDAALAGVLLMCQRASDLLVGRSVARALQVPLVKESGIASLRKVYWAEYEAEAEAAWHSARDPLIAALSHHRLSNGGAVTPDLVEATLRELEDHPAMQLLFVQGPLIRFLRDVWQMMDREDKFWASYRLEVQHALKEHSLERYRQAACSPSSALFNGSVLDAAFLSDIAIRIGALAPPSTPLSPKAGCPDKAPDEMICCDSAALDGILPKASPRRRSSKQAPLDRPAPILYGSWT